MAALIESVSHGVPAALVDAWPTTSWPTSPVIRPLSPHPGVPWPGACPRAWPRPWRSGWRGPRRRARPAAAAARGAARPTGRGLPAGPAALCTVKSAGCTRSRSAHATGNDTVRAGPGPRAVGRHDGRAAGPGRVEEHLPVAVLPDERGRRQLRVQPLRPGRDRPGRRRRVRARSGRPPAARRRARPWRRWSSPPRPAQPSRAPRAPAAAAATAGPKPSPAGGSMSRIRKSGWSKCADPHQRRVILDRALVGEPQQRLPVIAQRVRHLTARALRPDA